MKDIRNMSRERLCEIIERQELMIHNLRQAVEALGCTNRLFFTQNIGRLAENDEELIEYYVSHGGAKHFRERMSE